MKTAANRRQATRKNVKSCTIKHMNIKVGDDILLKAPKGKKPYVARVVEITADRGGKSVRIAGEWYYRPEDTKHGRRNFHGANELFRTNHVDIQLPESIEGICKVHTFETYVNFDEVDENDYFYRMDYNPDTGDFSVKRLEVFCVCNLPWNPDLVMAKCDECAGWYHPECLGISREEAQRTDVFICKVCQYLQSMIQRRTDEQADQERPSKKPRLDDTSPIPSETPGDAALPEPEVEAEGLANMYKERNTRSSP